MRANRMMKDQKVNRAGTGTAITGEVMTDEEVKAKKEQEKKDRLPFCGWVLHHQKQRPDPEDEVFPAAQRAENFVHAAFQN